MKNTVVTIQQMKEKGKKISMLTAYDYSTAKLEDEAGVNTILVGDSLGNVILGNVMALFIGLNLPERYDSPWSSCSKRCKKRTCCCGHAVYVVSDIRL